MPGGMTGRQLSDEARHRRPGLKTLFISGYTEDSIVHQGKLDPGVNFLSKPFRRRDLALKVREALEAQGADQGG
jgi:FixJ family two-component response regulator